MRNIVKIIINDIIQRYNVLLTLFFKFNFKSLRICEILELKLR